MQLMSAIAERLSTLKKNETQTAFVHLSTAYRDQQAHKVSGDKANALMVSYVAGRMPATYAVVSEVLQEYVELTKAAPKTLLDIGAGPGTATFAALEFFGLEAIHLIEKEGGFRDLALELANIAHAQPLLESKWTMGDVAQATIPRSDLVIASYSLGELPREHALEVSRKAFAQSRAFIVIEPGTPQGFATIRAIRDEVLAAGGHIAAPCPHQMPCPMGGTDFCHFSKRLTREKFHRDAKNATLPYEDEKYSYAIFVKEPVATYPARIVKRPMFGKGHVTLDLCSAGKIERRVVAKSHKEIYKKARKSEWGDRYDYI